MSAQDSGVISIDLDPNIPWFWQEALSHSSTIAVLSIYGAITLVGLFAAYRARHDSEDQEKILLVVRFLSCATFFFYDFVFMWLRFAWFINDEDANFVPHDLGDDGGMIWITEKYHSASYETREQYCGYKMDLPTEPTETPSCKFMFFTFEPDIISKGSGFEAGGAKFALGLGLLIYFALFWGGFALREWFSMDLAEKNEDDHLAARVCATALFSFFVLVLVSQQSLVMLPLTNLNVNDYCAELEVPASPKTAMCLHRFGVMGLPYGLLFVGVFLAALFCASASGAASAEADDEDAGKITMCLGFLCGCGGIFALFLALAFLVFWFFAGFVVGVWFTFGSLKNLEDLGAIKIVTFPAGMLNAEVVRALLFLLTYILGQPVKSAKKMPGADECYGGARTVCCSLRHCTIAFLPQYLRKWCKFCPQSLQACFEEDEDTPRASPRSRSASNDRDVKIDSAAVFVADHADAVNPQSSIELATVPQQRRMDDPSAMNERQGMHTVPSNLAQRSEGQAHWQQQQSLSSQAWYQDKGWQAQPTMGSGMFPQAGNQFSATFQSMAPIFSGPQQQPSQQSGYPRPQEPSVAPFQQPGVWPAPVMQGGWYPGF